MSLRMTEPYATTIAAVAPVILLVAVVEVQQFNRRARQRSAVMAAAYNDAANELEARGPEASLGELRELNARVAQMEDENRDRYSGFTRVLYNVWAYTAALLLAAEGMALTWLAGDNRLEDQLVAGFCLIALIWGTFVVATMSIVASIAQSHQEAKSAKTYRRALSRARTEARESSGEGIAPGNTTSAA
ncbi:hypothetical protein ACIOWI_14560 [Streptomyces sp. NPDC087659]|uniref:hypothetical protein n=1 Tax=Streptomyces sp. NPDC087659 TaxID=3365801 RepID=UPI0037FBB699